VVRNGPAQGGIMSDKKSLDVKLAIMRQFEEILKVVLETDDVQIIADLDIDEDDNNESLSEETPA